MKHLLIIIIFIIFQSPVFSFDESRYTPYSLDEINDEIDLQIKEVENGRDKGYILYDTAYSIKLTLKSYPTKTNKEINIKTKVYANLAGYFDKNEDSFINHFGYYFDYEYKSKIYKFIFQSVLIEDLIKEVKIGDTIVLHVIHGTYNDFDKTTTIFVNGFKTISKQ